MGAGGNMAARSRAHVLLTPSGLSLRDITPETVVTVDMTGRVLSGGRPSKEAGMHLEALRAAPGANVIFHVHGAYLIAAATLLEPGADTLPPLTPGFAYHAYPLPMIRFEGPGTDALARAVADHFARDGVRAVLLRNHGLVVTGRSYEEALDVTEEIQEAAEVFVLTQGKAQPLTPEAVRRIRRSGS